ncbi:hypothetical protein Cpap_1619 [Ruminiclostridium papyrosolvens DSM 2782]|uniref:Uncharacterized protein n=1 Tax=Ruminiclostridium papyrosolvens DSM 2782 TaxID=588581 RepID=F1TER0_9FIRM|nr:hypothetical protein [Ruminiclostridium papyrosolvens]EGD47226.1 hypothetical protein Cpap_1619 [Ruminiclostridium papyrosolvens DSM 2782]WES36265.1 hypothetical protein P0092_09940 [Ruminiclostridium papyrosolvens DSM 2782]
MNFLEFIKDILSLLLTVVSLVKLFSNKKKTTRKKRRRKYA